MSIEKKGQTRTHWFAEDRFGMFIHFGLYSNPAGMWKGQKMKHGYAEWLQASEPIPRAEYQRLASEFNPTDFDAEAWIREAKSAGMRYFVITAKHHDGFALWPTRASKYNVMDATPFKRDILGELAAACRKFDVKLGLYYHQLDFAWKSTEDLLKNLIGNAANGGNYQLNVGPKGDGRFQPAVIKRLRELGTWLAVNGESVYGTARSPLGKPGWGRITSRALENGLTRLYLHLWAISPGTALRLEGVPGTPIAAKVLETGQPVHVKAGAGELWLQLPIELRGLQLPVIAVDCRTPA